MLKLHTISRGVLAWSFVLAGLNHFISPDIYLRIMPPYLPWPAVLVAVSGIAEVVLGAAVLFPATRRLAAWGLIALLLAVFPANIHMALHPELFPQIPVALLWLRLPMQGVLIAWVYSHAGP